MLILSRWGINWGDLDVLETIGNPYFKVKC